MNLINSIDEYLLSSEGRKREHHYASDATACIRQLFYKWTGRKVSNPIEAGALWKMRMGDAIHGLIHEFLESSGYDIIDEVAARKEYEGLHHLVSVRADAIFATKDGAYYGVEVKSSYGAGIVQIQRKNTPKPEHVAQIALYADIFLIPKWILIYIGRDNGYRTQFEFTYKDGVLYLDGGTYSIAVKDIIDRLVRVEECVDTGAEPERDYKAAIKNGKIVDMFQKAGVKYKGDWQCNYCSFKDMCWQDEVARLQEGDNSDLFTITEYEEEL